MHNDLLDGKDDFLLVAGTVDILKSDVSERDLDDARPIGGVCSTERLDRQEEIVMQKGLDFDEFVKYGWFNDNHKQETAAAIGAPSSAEMRKGRWYTKGNLLKGYEPADRVWELAKALHKSTNIKRRLGFSIEGKVLERGLDNRIIRAKIRHVAITNSPVNTDCTWDILAKAFGTRDEVEASAIKHDSRDFIHRGELTLDQQTQFIKSMRPNYSWATCERLARVLNQLKEQARRK
jgi:hypothetical protein